MWENLPDCHGHPLKVDDEKEKEKLQLKAVLTIRVHLDLEFSYYCTNYFKRHKTNLDHYFLSPKS